MVTCTSQTGRTHGLTDPAGGIVRSCRMLVTPHAHPSMRDFASLIGLLADMNVQRCRVRPRKQPTDFDMAARNGVCAAASWIIPRTCHRLRSVLRDTDKEGYPDEQGRGQQGHCR